MARSNGKSELNPRELDTEHELPSSEETSDDALNPAAASPPAATAAAGEPGRDAELAKLKVERDMLLERLARLQAEFENARKRGLREQQEFREFALADALRALLPVLDSFERALRAHHPAKAEFRSGVELIYKQLSDALAKLGLQPVPAKGEPFDPHLHEAIEMVDTSDAQDHEILEELQRGYKLKDRLLRPAMVKIARNPKP
jgi:molecular chaperone GrpE